MASDAVERELRIVVPAGGRCLSKHRLTESEIVMPDVFVWNLLRITLELRRYVPSLG